MIQVTVAASTLFAVYVFTLFFLASIPENVVQTAETQAIVATVVK